MTTDIVTNINYLVTSYAVTIIYHLVMPFNFVTINSSLCDEFHRHHNYSISDIEKCVIQINSLVTNYIVTVYIHLVTTTNFVTISNSFCDEMYRHHKYSISDIEKCVPKITLW